jgi:hypothetical protein
LRSRDELKHGRFVLVFGLEEPSTTEVMMKKKSQSGAHHEQAPNLGQKDAALDKKKEAQLSHMSEQVGHGTGDRRKDDEHSVRKHK